MCYGLFDISKNPVFSYIYKCLLAVEVYSALFSVLHFAKFFQLIGASCRFWASGTDHLRFLHGFLLPQLKLGKMTSYLPMISTQLACLMLLLSLVTYARVLVLYSLNSGFKPFLFCQNINSFLRLMWPLTFWQLHVE